MNTRRLNRAGRLAATAALLECSVEKPGNVGPTRDFKESKYGDFAISSILLGEYCSLVSEGKMSIGEGILGYVEDALETIGTNTHLGTAILFMPLARAAGDAPVEPDELEKSIANVLSYADHRESILVCRAIRIMKPAGLRDPAFRRANLEDLVHDIESRKLGYIEWMNMGSEMDGVAKETVENYPRTFSGARMLLSHERIRDGILELDIQLLSESLDTFVVGQRGMETALEVMRMASCAKEKLSEEGWPDFMIEVSRLDSFCREKNANPGTTADLVGSSLYAALLCGGKP